MSKSEFLMPNEMSKLKAIISNFLTFKHLGLDILFEICN